MLTLIFVSPVGLLLMWLYAPWSKRTKWIWSGVIAALVGLIILGSVVGEDPDDRAIAGNNNPLPSASPTLTADQLAFVQAVAAARTSATRAAEETRAALPARASTPIPSPSPAPPPDAIPGIAADDAVARLEGLGLACDGPRQLQTTIQWVCTSGSAFADVLAFAPDRVRSVSITSFESSDPAAAELLADFAALMYGGSEPERARAWVTENIWQYAELTIGDVHFTLSGDVGTRTLDVVAVGAR